jgi:hypothetical protein|tara:strand:- start:234 stop:764 length:531 start_codon:yes stop_codon:yes gene_type:complete
MFLTEMSFKELFNIHKKDNLIKLYKIRIISNFRSAVLQLKAIIDDDYDICNNQLKGWTRLTMGYRGIGFNNGVYSNLKTKQTVNKNNKEITFDHVIGATLCGEVVKEVIQTSNYNHSYLINNWLFDNLYLWGTIKVTKKQHNKNNILRNKNSLTEKNNLDHYKNITINDLITDKKL